ncbi:MAG TPA: hypothetical protein GX518_00870 [Firmicutes bacterium]|nr:hypothetical protein [Bacillota bacterium]
MKKEFQSPTRGPLSFNQVFHDLIAYVEEAPQFNYRIIIGTDSQSHDREVVFVTAIVVHREGKGARYYYSKKTQDKIFSLRQRIFYEASLSLDVASRLTALLAENGHNDLNIEVHLDVGKKGETKELIREIVGMVAGSGFEAKIKPDAYGASTVADKYTK